MVSDEIIMQWIGQYLWPFVRIGAFLMTMPLLSSRLVSTPIRLVLGLWLTIAVAPYLPAPPAIHYWSTDALLLFVNQIVIGSAIGIGMQIFFQIFQVAGQFIAMQNGLGFATMVDPVNGINVAAVGQIFLILTNLLFLSLGGHLVVIEIVISSFHILPLTDMSHNMTLFQRIVGMASWMYQVSLLIALPSVISLLISNISFGLMARLAPQLNIFSVGFPFNMIFGLVVLWVVLQGFLPLYEKIAEEALMMAQSLLIK
jgi:flagellar biosynthetic protein FliR